MSQDIAAKDIVRRDEALGVNRLVVPKGMPIPDHVDATDEERGKKSKPAKKKAESAPENKKA